MYVVKSMFKVFLQGKNFFCYKYRKFLNCTITAFFSQFLRYLQKTVCYHPPLVNGKYKKCSRNIFFVSFTNKLIDLLKVQFYLDSSTILRINPIPHNSILREMIPTFLFLTPCNHRRFLILTWPRTHSMIKITKANLKGVYSQKVPTSHCVIHINFEFMNFMAWSVTKKYYGCSTYKTSPLFALGFDFYIT